MRPLLTPLALAAVLWVVPASARTYLCFGDSNTFGFAGSNNDAYLGHLAGILRAAGETDVVMLNYGLGGESIAGNGSAEPGAKRLDGVLALETMPSDTVVLIMEGTNDIEVWGRGQATPANTEAALEHMIEEVGRYPGMRVVVATVLPRVNDRNDRDGSQTNDLNNRIVNVANGRASIARVFEAVAPYASSLTYRDSLHPADLLQPIVAEAFAAAILGGRAPDITGPLPVSAVPAPGATRVPLDTAVELTMRDLGSPIDTVTAVFSVDGVAVATTTSSPRANDLTFTYNFPEQPRFAQVVNISLQVADTAVPPNRTAFSYSFRVLDGNGTGGDVDRSGRVDGRDMALLAAAFGSSSGASHYLFAADVDGNGLIDGQDLAVLAASFGGRP